MMYRHLASKARMMAERDCRRQTGTSLESLEVHVLTLFSQADANILIPQHERQLHDQIDAHTREWSLILRQQDISLSSKQEWDCVDGRTARD